VTAVLLGAFLPDIYARDGAFNLSASPSAFLTKCPKGPSKSIVIPMVRCKDLHIFATFPIVTDFTILVHNSGFQNYLVKFLLQVWTIMIVMTEDGCLIHLI